jgi:hypothetical protein
MTKRTIQLKAIDNDSEGSSEDDTEDAASSDDGDDDSDTDDRIAAPDQITGTREVTDSKALPVKLKSSRNATCHVPLQYGDVT